MTRIGVDFNRRVHGGLVRAISRRADGELRLGGRVEAFDFTDPDMSFTATIVDLTDDQALLEVDWAPARTHVSTDEPSTRAFGRWFAARSDAVVGRTRAAVPHLLPAG